MALLQGTPRNATVEALTTVRVWALSRHQLDKVISGREIGSEFARCIVFGSVNKDIAISTNNAYPAPGHTMTVLGSYESSFGGKGFNEALCVGRLNVPTWLVGRVGESDGPRLNSQFQGSGVNCDMVL